MVNDLGGGTHGDGKSSKTADLVVDEIKRNGGQAVANYDSVTDGDRIIKTAIDAYGRIDILINNAGILRDVSFSKLTDKDWDLIFQVHMVGTYKTTKAAWEHMRKNKYGRIVNVTSAAGLYGNFGQANYSAAKLGILGFTKTIAREGASKNILANCIAPIAASRMTETVMPKEMLANLKPEYVAPVVAYLVHDSLEADCTGQCFELGAGWISALRWQRAKGGFLPFGDTSPEAVKKVWKDVMNFDNDPQFPESTQDALASVMENVGRYEKAKAKL